jgi:hypothetical protein
MASFIGTLNPTPFGLYDSSLAFQRDADSMVVYVKRKLGEDFLSVELTKKEIWACFEEATKLFNAWVIEYQTISNLASLLGTPTGSYDSTTGRNTINLTNTYIAPNLEFLDRLAEPYANIIGWGSTQNSFSGSIDMVTGKQDYDLYTDLKDEYGNPLYSMLSGSGGKMRVVEVYHYAPIQYLFNSSFGTNFGGVGGVGIPLGAFNSDTRFHILPLFEDVLRSGQLKLGGKVRRSHYNYKISGRSFRVFPVPGSIVPGVNDKVWIRVAFSAAPGGAFIDLATSGSAVSSSYYSATAAGFSGPSYGASNPANIPMGLIEYATLNQWAKNWIARMTLALATEVLGRTRRKVSRIPIPGSEVELDGSQLVTEAREDQEKLMEGLKEKLESLSYSKLQEQQATQAENLMKQLSFLPMPPTHTIRMFE